MCEELSSAEIDDQHMEVLPERTVLSLFSAATDPPGSTGSGSPNSYARVSAASLLKGSIGELFLGRGPIA